MVNINVFSEIWVGMLLQHSVHDTLILHNTITFNGICGEMQMLLWRVIACTPYKGMAPLENDMLVGIVDDTGCSIANLLETFFHRES